MLVAVRYQFIGDETKRHIGTYDMTVVPEVGDTVRIDAFEFNVNERVWSMPPAGEGEPAVTLYVMREDRAR